MKIKLPLFFTTGQFWITQTEHGGKQLAWDCTPLKHSVADRKVIAPFDGTVVKVDKAYSPNGKGGNWVVFEMKIGIDVIKLHFVHVHKAKKIGTKVKKGNIICYIAPKSVTGYGEHLHVFMQAGNTYINLMEFLDRNIRIDTAYNEIKNYKDKQGRTYFVNGKFNWDRYADKHFTIKDVDNCEECKKQTKRLKSENSKLKNELNNTRQELDNVRNTWETCKKERQALRDSLNKCRDLNKVLTEENRKLKESTEDAVEYRFGMKFVKRLFDGVFNVFKKPASNKD